MPEPTAASLIQAVRRFEAQFEIADDNAAVTECLLNLLGTQTIQGKQIHDANIVATVLRYEIPSLLTHNTADFKRYSPLIQVCRSFHKQHLPG